jgi:hypothetical protein
MIAAISGVILFLVFIAWMFTRCKIDVDKQHRRRDEEKG